MDNKTETKEEINGRKQSESVQMNRWADLNIPDRYISEILRTGGGRRDSRSRIYAAYCQERSPEEMVHFLRKEYKAIGKGFWFDGRPLSAWFDDRGMRAAFGAAARGNDAVSFSWKEIEMYIHSMVEKGIYMDAGEITLLDDYECSYMSSRIVDFYYAAEQALGVIQPGMQGSMEDFHVIKKQLADKKNIDQIVDCMESVMETLDEYGLDLQKRLGCTPEEIRNDLYRMKKSHRNFPALQKLDVKQEHFITQDELMLRIGAYSGGEESFRIYDYFKQGFPSVANIAFLKKEKCEDSIISAFMGAEHVIWNQKDSAYVFMNSGNNEIYSKELLTWDMVEKNISCMVNNGTYLAADSSTAYRLYEQNLQKYDTKLKCRDAIEGLIKEKYTGGKTPRNAARGIIDQYGWKCVKSVLANTIISNTGYRCFDRETRRWAARINLSEKRDSQELAVKVNPAYVDTFIKQARHYHRKCEKKTAAVTETCKKSTCLVEKVEETDYVSRSGEAYGHMSRQRENEFMVAELSAKTVRVSIKNKMQELEENNLSKVKTDDQTMQCPQHGSMPMPANEQQNRISIKEKIVATQEKNCIQKNAQVPSVENSRKKEICM